MNLFLFLLLTVRADRFIPAVCTFSFTVVAGSRFSADRSLKKHSSFSV